MDVASWRWGLAAIGALGLVSTVVFWRLLPPSVAGVPVRTATAARLRWNPALLALLALPFLLMGGFVATYNFVTYRLTAAPFDVSDAVIGAIFLTYLAGTAASAIAGRVADRAGRAPVLFVSLALMAAGLLLTLPPWLPAVAIGLLVFTAGFFGAHSVASGWAPVVGAARPATASALYVFAYYAGSSLFGSVVGLGWHAGGWSLTVTIIEALVALAAAATVVVAVRLRAPATPRPAQSAPPREGVLAAS
jgi:YNFM family putative membrane transporter